MTVSRKISRHIFFTWFLISVILLSLFLWFLVFLLGVLVVFLWHLRCLKFNIDWFIYLLNVAATATRPRLDGCSSVAQQLHM